MAWGLLFRLTSNVQHALIAKVSSPCDAGLTLDGDATDEGENHYVFASKPAAKS